MSLLASDDRVIFVGQNVGFSGHVMFETLDHIPEDKRLEFPVAEDFQVGLCTGLALSGLVPICCIPRIDFLVLAMNQLVNHLDKLSAMSQGQFNPKVIIRTMIGNTIPLHPGPQHSQNHSEALRLMLKHTRVFTPETAEEVIDSYRCALAGDGPALVVEPAYR